jgi:Interferon-induced transmembrane protein
MVTVTQSSAQGDADPVSQFSDPGLMHSYAEAPPPGLPQPPCSPGYSYGYPAYPASTGYGMQQKQAPGVSPRWPRAIASIIFFLPLGIAACVYAARVHRALKAGDLPGAVRASNRVKLFFWISLATFILIYFVASGLASLPGWWNGG